MDDERDPAEALDGLEDEDDGEDEVAKNLAAASLEPIFKPRGRKAEVAKEA